MQRDDLKDLKFRYLLWLYKNAKEELDRIERKFTQVDIDRKIFRYMSEHIDSTKLKRRDESGKFLKELKAYSDKKEKNGAALKFEEGKLKPAYYHLVLKLEAVEKAIADDLGRRGLKGIKALYEHEMRRRIIEAKEHR
jgi:hypothetical protein